MYKSRKKTTRKYRPQGEVNLKNTLPDGWRRADPPDNQLDIICPIEGSWVNIPMRKDSEIARLLGWPNTCINELPVKILERGRIDNGYVGFGCYVEWDGKPQKDISWKMIEGQKHASYQPKETK